MMRTISGISVSLRVSRHKRVVDLYVLKKEMQGGQSLKCSSRDELVSASVSTVGGFRVEERRVLLSGS